jgi:hypothetical protein
MKNRFLHPRLPGTEKGNRHNHKRFGVRGENSPWALWIPRASEQKTFNPPNLAGLFDCSNGSAFGVGASLEA